MQLAIDYIKTFPKGPSEYIYLISFDIAEDDDMKESHITLED